MKTWLLIQYYRYFSLKVPTKGDHKGGYSDTVVDEDYTKVSPKSVYIIV